MLYRLNFRIGRGIATYHLTIKLYGSLLTMTLAFLFEKEKMTLTNNNQTKIDNNITKYLLET